ncbi:anti-sigma factor [Sphingomonas sp. Tas61C01]|uniref:anti-sigma factor n=1 Tax=Sphingomonas sp. Tas61C01 TaxID=3458297 RepID=UPI00403EEF27
MPAEFDETEDLMAAELALGLLDGEERAVALRRMLAEPAFARDVETWRLHFAQLFDLWPGVEAPEDLIERIDATLGGPGTDRRPSRLPWPLLAIASSALAACLLVVIALRPEPAPVVFTPAPAPIERSGPVLVASLDYEKTPIASFYDPARGALRVAASPAIDADRVAQLWVIGADGVPHSLGLLTRAATALTVPAANRARLAAGAVLAISVEPLGGSPTGLPTGPVVAKGALSSV